MTGCIMQNAGGQSCKIATLYAQTIHVLLLCAEFGTILTKQHKKSPYEREYICEILRMVFFLHFLYNMVTEK